VAQRTPRVDFRALFSSAQQRLEMVGVDPGPIDFERIPVRRGPKDRPGPTSVIGFQRAPQVADMDLKRSSRRSRRTMPPKPFDERAPLDAPGAATEEATQHSVHHWSGELAGRPRSEPHEPPEYLEFHRPGLLGRHQFLPGL